MMTTQTLLHIPSLQSLTRSSIAVLECGNIHARDVIYVDGGQLARIAGFWRAESGVITAHCTACEHVGGYKYRDSETVIFVKSESIIDAVAYRKLLGGEFRVVLPFLARYR